MPDLSLHAARGLTAGSAAGKDLASWSVFALCSSRYTLHVAVVVGRFTGSVQGLDPVPLGYVALGCAGQPGCVGFVPALDRVLWGSLELCLPELPVNPKVWLAACVDWWGCLGETLGVKSPLGCLQGWGAFRAAG